VAEEASCICTSLHKPITLQKEKELQEVQLTSRATTPSSDSSPLPLWTARLRYSCTIAHELQIFRFKCCWSECTSCFLSSCFPPLLSTRETVAEEAPCATASGNNDGEFCLLPDEVDKWQCRRVIRGFSSRSRTSAMEARHETQSRATPSAMRRSLAIWSLTMPPPSLHPQKATTAAPLTSPAARRRLSPRTVHGENILSSTLLAPV
jgi:hypothetical protein